MRRHCAAVLTSLVLLLSAHSLARAETVCFPPATGVPGQPGLPDWWSGSAPVDDPRWAGAYAYGNANVTFQALAEIGASPHLVLEWVFEGDATPAQVGDAIYVGYSPDGTGASAKVVAWEYKTTGPAVRVSRWSSGTWVDDPAVPAFVYRHDVLGAAEWALRMRIPVTAGSSSALAWWQMVADFSAYTIAPKWPTSAPDVDVGGTIPYPPVAQWNTVSLGGTGCVAGIDLQPQHISVDNAAFGTGTNLDVYGPNTFHARPTNQTLGALDGASVISAKLRIADWGSAVAVSPAWTAVPGCDNAVGAAGAVAPGDRFDLRCRWTLNADQRCKYASEATLPATCPPGAARRSPHPCILVELKPLLTNTRLVRQAACRNFDFVTTTGAGGGKKRIEAHPIIDVRGLPPQSRDVAIYLRAWNMPERLEAVQTAQQPGDPEAIGVASALATVRKLLGQEIQLGRVDGKTANTMKSLLALGKITVDQIRRVMPSYLAYVWHSTGRSIRSNGASRPLWESQPSFGLFIAHDGELLGWSHGLSADARVLRSRKPGIFELRIPDTGSIRLTSTVEALQAKTETNAVAPAQTQQPARRLIALAVVIVVLLFVLMVLRRKKTD